MNVGVLCGGASSERTISLRSGKAVFEALARSGVTAHRVDPKTTSLNFKKALSRMDVAFIALHGKGGEDGSIQTRLEGAEIPYVGSGPRGSWLAFNKVEAKKIFDKKEIPTPRWTTLRSKDWRKLEKFGAPFFIKPVDDGSSIGVFLVEDFTRSAEKIMQGLVKEAQSRWGIEKVQLLHRIGRLNIGEAAVVISVSSAHRAESFEACRFLIEKIKSQVPIWKKEIFEDGTGEWVSCAHTPTEAIS